MSSSSRAALIAAITAAGCARSSPPTRPGLALDPTPPSFAPGPPLEPAFEALARGEEPEATCFAVAPARGEVMCVVGESSIQGGAQTIVRVLGGAPEELVVYVHPEDEQFFQVDPARVDQAAVARARARADEGGFQGWAGPDQALAPGATLAIGGATLRRTRTRAGRDGDPATGVWETFTDVVELRCPDGWRPLALPARSFGHPVGEASIAVARLRTDTLLLTASVGWGIEGDSGGATDAVTIEPAARCARP